MISHSLKRLLQKLNDHTTRALEQAVGFAVARGHYEVTHEHLFLKLLEDGSGDLPLLLRHFGVEPGRFGEALNQQLEQVRTGNSGRPAFSPLLLELIEAAWLVASVHHGLDEVRSGCLLEALVGSDRLGAGYRDVLDGVQADALREEFGALVDGSAENRVLHPSARRRLSGDGAPPVGNTALDLYTQSVTDQAREGRIDPIFGRDEEIRQMIDILSRRRKNNPILVGEAGVGKTAVVEGLALRIAEGDVPDSLREVEIRSLDLGLLQAGAGVKGEFEQRLKSVIEEIREAPTPTIMFIDEAHTLIGAGGAAGTGDAANMLKPALARGELRSIAATTWSEYKKHIEKDPALARRFQLIKVEEPAVESAIVMMRGIKSKYEDHHNVRISEAAIAQAVTLADRFITGRQLPDKAVDLLDTSAARVKMTQSARPGALDDARRRLHTLNIEIAALERDLATGLRHDADVVVDLQRQRSDAEHLVEALQARWDAERALVQRVDEARKQIAHARQTGADPTAVEDLRATLDELLQTLEAQRAAAESDHALVHAEVNGDVVAQVVSDWTGVPIGNMIKDEAQMLLTLDERLRSGIRGQDEALGQVADSIRSAKAGLGNPDAPLAVFLFVGPSGVGKTETARQLAEMMFGGERFLVSINMSEYQESHTVSQLKGSPPGYVGYGEGGILTEAVRQRPYSVVLLDEVEKAHIDVMELFYQVFDRGFMRDGEGREINFRNTIILATSNIGSDRIQQACMAEERPTADELRALIHDDLARHFQPALLARMKVVPYYSLEPAAMRMITRLKLGKIDRRLRAAHGIRFVFSDDVVDRIAERCTQVDAGARNIDFIIDRTLLPEASRTLLVRLADDEELPAALHLGIDDVGAFTYTFSDTIDPGQGDGVPSEAAPALAEEPPEEEVSPLASQDANGGTGEPDEPLENDSPQGAPSPGA